MILVDPAITNGRAVTLDSRTAVVGVGLDEQPKWLADDSVYIHLAGNPPTPVLVNAVKHAYQFLYQKMRADQLERQLGDRTRELQQVSEVGIALSTSLVALANVGWMLGVLRRRLGGIDGMAVVATGVRTGVAGAVLALVSLGTLRAVGHVVGPAGFSGAAIPLVAALVAGSAAYLGVCAILGVRELALLGSLTQRGRSRSRPAGSAEV